VLTREGHLDNVEIRCELQHDADGMTPERIAGIAKRLQHHIKTNIGISTKVTVMHYGTLPRTQTGKARRVFDERPKQH